MQITNLLHPQGVRDKETLKRESKYNPIPIWLNVL